MRKIDILNKNYEVANLNTVVYEGYSIKQIIEDSPVFDVTPPQHYLDYWQKIYDYLKDGTQLPGHTYIPSGQSKYDIAYINKTIDDPIAELNGHTLREVFEEENIIENNDFKSLSNWNISRASSTLITEGVKLNVIGTLAGEYGYIWQNILSDILPNNDYYEWIDLTTVGPEHYGSTLMQYTNLGNVPQTNNIPYQLGRYITTIQGTSLNGTYTIAHLRLHLSNGNGTDIILHNIGMINKTKLGIAHLSKNDMDYYLNLYFLRKTITKKQLTYADIFEKNSRSESYLGASGLYPNTWIVKTPLKKGKYFMHYEFVIYSGTISGINIQSRNPSTTTYLFNSQLYVNSVEINELIDKVDIVLFVRDAINLNYFQSYIFVEYSDFDESITKEKIELMMNYYFSIQNNVIYPENFISLEPTGFGNRYKFKELNTKVYGHEMDFEKMQLNLLFGTYRNAYESFNLLMNFMINNEAIISYDYGKGIRYTDVRLIAAPKTELDNGQHMRSKFDFKRLSPFYTIEEGSTLTIKNVHDWDIKPIISGTVNTNIVYIEAEDTTTTVTLAVKFDFTSLTKPFNFYYNAETKQILINGINNGYQYIDFSYGVSFISLPKNTEHLITTTGITSPVVKAKKWVID